MTLEVMKSH